MKYFLILFLSFNAFSYESDLYPLWSNHQCLISLNNKDSNRLYKIINVKNNYYVIRVFKRESNIFFLTENKNLNNNWIYSGTKNIAFKDAHYFLEATTCL